MEEFNNNWVLFICFILFIIIIKKLYNLLFDNYEESKQNNQHKFDLTPSILPTITSYYVGII